MKLYLYRNRRKPGTNQLEPYKYGPFDSLEKFFEDRGKRPPEFPYALVDEATDPPTFLRGIPISGPAPLGKDPFISLPYPFLIRQFDGALITGDGIVVFEGGPR